MKKMVCMLLAAFLLLTGCQSAVPEETAAPAETAAASVPEELTVPTQTMPDMTTGQEEGRIICFQNSGKARIGYTGDRRSVKYITSVDQLPDEEALKGYDAAFFEENALVVVVETVSSGSVQLEIESIHITGGTATVTLKRTMPGGEGTDDMATWLLWVEVEQGLDCQWVLKGNSRQPQGETS